MNSRIAQIIADAMDDKGNVDRQKVYRSLLLVPDDPTTLIVDACLFLQEIPEQVQTAIGNSEVRLQKVMTEITGKSVASLNAVRDKFVLAITPLDSSIRRFRYDLDSAERLLSGFSSEMNVAETTIRQITSINRSAVVEMESAIRKAFDSLKVDHLGQRLTGQLEANTISPFRDALEKLFAATREIDTATASANNAVATWRKVQLKTVIGICAVASFLLFGGIFLLSWWNLGQRNEKEFLAFIASQKQSLISNQEALRELSALGVSISISNVVDKAGKNVPRKYALTLEHPLDARLERREENQVGVIYFRSLFNERVSQLIRGVSETAGSGKVAEKLSKKSKAKEQTTR